MNAFVEVVFDNSDNRFALENSDEVVLRRTVGSKKDEFFLQRKRATKQEVQSLLEGAGFSKSNPYFMVQQGKIQSLCLMSDTQRLKLLQEVAGTTLYEDKKAESLIKMDENTRSIEKINSILSDIDGRLGELKGEKEELSHYQSYDRTRKALEYSLYDKELRKARHVLDQVEHDRMEHVHRTAQLHEISKQTHDEIQAAEGQLKLKSQRLKRSILQTKDLTQDKSNIVALKTKLTLEQGELQDNIQTGEESIARSKAELKQLEKKIDKAKADLSTNETILRDHQTLLQQSLQRKDTISMQIDALYEKQGRGKEYSSKEERDRSLQQQIKDLATLQKEKQEYLAQQHDILASLRRSVDSGEKQVAGKKGQLAQKTSTLQSLHAKLDEASKQHHSAIDLRKERWREAEALEDQLREARDTLQNAKGIFRKSMPRATSMGIRALTKIVEEEGLIHGQQYFGMVIDNMTLRDPKYQTAVEIAAQNALFHVIVDRDSTAARLMNRLEKEQLGRVTFLPLNQIRLDSNRQLPQSNDIAPLIDTCLSFDPKVSLAMRHVFDKKMLARNADLASEWSEKYHLDCITLDGDLCSRKGALTGGYIDSKKSRLRAHEAERRAEKEHRKMSEAFQEADSESKKTEQEVTRASQQVNRMKHELTQLSRAVQGLEGEVSTSESQLTSSKKQIERIENHVLPPAEREIASIKGNIQRLEDEIGTDLSSSLSTSDRAAISSLNEEMEDLQGKLAQQTDRVDELRVNRRQIESLLEDNLLKRRQELLEVNHEGARGTVKTSRQDLQDERVRELEDLNQSLQQATADLNNVDSQLEELRGIEAKIKEELRLAKNEMDRLKSQDVKNLRLLDEASEQSEKLMSKVSFSRMFGSNAYSDLTRTTSHDCLSEIDEHEQEGQLHAQNPGVGFLASSVRVEELH